MNLRRKFYVCTSLVLLSMIFVFAGCGKNPEASDTHLKMGIDLAGINKLDDAMNEYNMALKLNPDNSEAYYRRAMIYSSRNEHRYSYGRFERSNLNQNRLCQVF